MANRRRSGVSSKSGGGRALDEGAGRVGESRAERAFAGGGRIRSIATVECGRGRGYHLNAIGNAQSAASTTASAAGAGDCLGEKALGVVLDEKGARIFERVEYPVDEGTFVVIVGDKVRVS